MNIKQLRFAKNKKAARTDDPFVWLYPIQHAPDGRRRSTNAP